ncbi:MAG: hypothetical protein HUU35_00340, partial [Armatimonadetes bacterium]|nr:hypothetical protein [Armatimonadota bacterium]
GAALASEVRELFNGRLEGVLSRLSHADREQLDHGLKALLHAALLSPADCEAACLRCGVDRTEDCVVHIAELTFQHHRSAR